MHDFDRRCYEAAPLMHDVMMACPSFLAVLKQLSACSGAVPGMTVVIACTTSFSVWRSWSNSMTLHPQDYRCCPYYLSVEGLLVIECAGTDSDVSCMHNQAMTLMSHI